MAYVKFKNQIDPVQASVIPMTENVVKIFLPDEPNLSGFNLFLDEQCTLPMDNGEYEGFDTLYFKGDGWYELSNDGSVFDVPEPVAHYEPTEEELAEIERQNRIQEIQNKIDSIKQQLKDTDYMVIKNHEYEDDGEEKPYNPHTIHVERQALRDELEELEAEIKRLSEQE